MPAPKTVLDLGANIGATAAHYRFLWPDAEIVAVEPEPGNVSVLRANSDARVIEAAVAGFSGNALLTTEQNSQAYCLAPHGDLSVRCVTLTELINDELNGHVDFVKMDVEGAEYGIIEDGTWAPLVSYLLVELHGFSVSDTCAKLEALGFQAEPHPPHPNAIWAWR